MPLPEIERAFKRKPAFMPYFPVGYPTLPDSLDALEALGKNGADLIEVGIPFSDPLADGPVIQQATQVALHNGVTLHTVLDSIAELRRRGVAVPLILMGYYNPILQFGLKDFARAAEKAGADGVIVPDLPVEESAELEDALGGGLPYIRMLAPTTAADRAHRICATAKGFLYLVSVTGVTGARDTVSTALPGFVSRVRSAVPAGLPLCVGFGIATPAQAAEIGRIADGVIVGSACVRAIGEAQDPKRAATEFADSFRKALDGA
jgi:tryptophan synthase alpha chain